MDMRWSVPDRRTTRLRITGLRTAITAVAMVTLMATGTRMATSTAAGPTNTGTGMEAGMAVAIAAGMMAVTAITDAVATDSL